jgi:hypothetical protein
MVTSVACLNQRAEADPHGFSRIAAFLSVFTCGHNSPPAAPLQRSVTMIET